ncbi:MAG TPA: hypothetical protein VGD69_21290 [Herpetosiphonaceae bacterium]
MSRSHRRRSIAIAALIALGSFGMVSQPQPARAAALTVDVVCTDAVGGDYQYSNFTCNIQVDNGTYQYNWAWMWQGSTRNQNYSGYSYTTGDGVVTGQCLRGYNAGLTLQISDNREVVRDTSMFYCS